MRWWIFNLVFSQVIIKLVLCHKYKLLSGDDHHVHCTHEHPKADDVSDE